MPIRYLLVVVCVWLMHFLCLPPCGQVICREEHSGAREFPGSEFSLGLFWEIAAPSTFDSQIILVMTEKNEDVVCSAGVS